MASAAEPVGFTRAGPSGPTTTVASPLSSTVTPSCCASRRADPTRSPVSSAPGKRANSRSCGVSSVGSVRPSSHSGCAAHRVSASASTRTGTSWARTASTVAAASSSVPRPGPTTHACTRPASPTCDPRCSVTTASGQRARTCSAAWGAPAKRTMPAPATTAAPTLSTAAPVYCWEPAATPTTPRVYLSDLPSLPGSRRPTSAASSSSTGAGSSHSASPMSTRCTRPAQPRPAPTTSPGLSVPKVTVSAARTAAPSTAPVSASTPLGRSTATTSRSCSCPTSSAESARSGPRPPIPTRPSSTRAPGRARSEGTCSDEAAPTRPPADSSAARASGRGVPVSTAVTPAPRAANRAPAHSASAPLSPDPASTITVEP